MYQWYTYVYFTFSVIGTFLISITLVLCQETHVYWKESIKTIVSAIFSLAVAVLGFMASVYFEWLGIAVHFGFLCVLYRYRHAVARKLCFL